MLVPHHVPFTITMILIIPIPHITLQNPVHSAQVMLVWLCFVWSKAYLRGFEDCDVALTVWGYVLYSAMLLNFAKSTSCGQRAVGALCVPWEMQQKCCWAGCFGGALLLLENLGTGWKLRELHLVEVWIRRTGCT